MQLENVAMEAEERAADAAEFASWGTGRRARASFAIAALQLDYSRRIVDALERIVGDGKPCIANDMKITSSYCKTERGSLTCNAKNTTCCCY